MNLKMKYIYLILFAFFIPANDASAHRVVAFAWVDGDTVFVESQFQDGKKVAGGEVKVYDLEGQVLLTGKTDAKGEFSFKIPKPAGMRIVLNAGMGHQGEWTLPDTEVIGSPGLSEKNEINRPADRINPESVDIAESQSRMIPSPREEDPSRPDAFYDDKQIEEIVERVLERKLKPVTRMLVELQQSGPSISEIFGGIGYIFGLMGVAMYFISKRKKD